MDYTLEYKEIAGKTVITSPDLPGLHVVGDSREDAAGQLDRAIKRLLEIRRRQQNCGPADISVVPLRVSVQVDAA